MSTRKRCLSPTAITDNKRRKGARLISDLWSPQTKSSSSYSSTSSQDSAYTIRAIIGEKPGAYLIDWADDKFTGEAYSPNWQPKKNVSREAVLHWENKKVAENSKQSKKRQRRNRSNSLSVTIHYSALCTSQKRTHLPRSTLTRRPEYPTTLLSRRTTISQSSYPELTVLVSEHSSLDKEQYILYQSSLSSSASSAVPHPQNSEIGLPLLSSTSKTSSGSSQVKTIPDSQPAIESSCRSVSSVSLTSIRNVASESIQTIPCSIETLDSSGDQTNRLQLERKRPQDPDLTSGESRSQSSLSRSPLQQAQLISPPRDISQPLPISNVSFFSLDSISPSVPESCLDRMAETGSSLPAENNSQSPLRSDPPRISFTQRMRELDAGFRKVNEAIEAKRRPNQAAYAANAAQSLARTPASPLRRDGQSTPTASPTQMASPTQRPSPRVPQDSLPQTRSVIESTPTAVSGEKLSSQRPSAELPAVPSAPLSNSTPTPDRFPHPQAAPELQPATRTLLGSGSAAPNGSMSSPNIPSRSLPIENANELHPTHPKPRSHHNIAATMAPSPDQDKAKRPASQPLAPLQHQLDRNPRAQPQLAGGGPMPVPVATPLLVHDSQPNQQMAIRPGYAFPYPETAFVHKTDSLRPYEVSPNEHSVSLAASSRIRNTYINLLSLSQQAVMEFTHSEAPSQDCLRSVETLISRLDCLTTHSDLDAQETPETPSQTASPEGEADWAENCSFKFQFLRHFFAQIRDRDVHVGIVARPGRLLNIIETWLKGRGIVYFRLDGRGAALPNDPRFAQCKCQVSLVPSGPEGMNMAVKPASLVIAFDGSVNVQDSQVYRMRVREGCSWLMPVAHLLVYKSAEHVARCLPPQMDPWTRLRKLVACMAHHRHEVGILPPEDCNINAVGKEVGISIELGGQESRWTLPPIRPIQLDFLESSHGSSTQEDSQSGTTPEAGTQSSAIKRAWATEAADLNMIKRQRVSPAANVSHMEQLQQHNGFLIHENTTLKTQIFQQNASLNTAREELATRSRANQDLQSQLTAHKTHITDLESSLSDLQYRYETRNRAYLEAHSNHSTLLTQTDRANKRLEAQTAEINIFKETIKALEKEVQEARDWLSGSSAPHIAKFAAAQNEARAAVAENRKLVQRNKSLSEDLDFTRSSYQSASSSAADLASEVAALKAQVETLEQKASGEAARLAAINRDNAVKEARKEVRQLRLSLDEREKLCRRREEE
ncbi:MAG: hypothetical protein Q9218_006083, partial [Villophora microphyllina]